MSLYPPIIDYSMPTFDYKAASVRIYFSLSPYSRLQDIQQIHVSVRYQSNNANALSPIYVANVKATNILQVAPQEDPVIAASAKRYYIILNATDLIKNKFEQGTIYKIQLRASNKSLPQAPNEADLALGLASFSEWSTVCLLKPIELPDFEILNLVSRESSADNSATTSVIFQTLTATFVGKYIGGEDNERLASYKAELWNDTETIKVAEIKETLFSGYNYLPTGNKNTVSVSIDMQREMQNNTDYVLKVILKTKNGHTFTRHFNFTAMQYSTDVFPGLIQATPVESQGYINLKLNGDTVVNTNITIRRSSSESNFEAWEDITNLQVVQQRININYKDLTAQSGIIYRYGAQTRDNRGRRGLLTVSNTVMGEWEDAFLVQNSGFEDECRQLKIRYNFNITNGTINVAESKTDTLGSQYPFIRRNGEIYYKSYQISGLITAYMDSKERLFASLDKIYGGTKNRYKDILDERQQHTHPYDYITQKRFRDLVFEFLFNDKIKLFKSNQQGNILVKLMNVTFTPVDSLDRMLYNFSATMYQVDKVSIPTLQKYGVINLGEWSSNITFSNEKLGYLTSWTNLPDQNTSPVLVPFAAGRNIIEDIKTKEGYQKSDGTVVVTDFSITDLRIEIQSPPYMIYDNGRNTTVQNYVYSSTDKSRLMMGWLFTINGEKVVLKSPHNVYELRGDDVNITPRWTIIPAKATQMNITYKIALSKQVDYSKTASVLEYRDVIGQIRGTFEPTENIFNAIKYKYYLDLPEYYQVMDQLTAIEVDAEPGTIFYGRTRGRDQSKWVVGETGILFIHPLIENEYITDFYIKGVSINMNYAQPTGVDGTAGKAVFETKHNKGTDKPQLPAMYDYYTENGKTYIWYKGDWRQASFVGDCIEILCPADAMIEYNGQVVKGIYSRNI